MPGCILVPKHFPHTEQLLPQGWLAVPDIVGPPGPGQQLQVQGCHFLSLGWRGLGVPRYLLGICRRGWTSLPAEAGAGLWAVSGPFSTLLQLDAGSLHSWG